MAIGNMAMILLAGGAAIIGVSFLVKPKDEEAQLPTGAGTEGLTVAQLLELERARATGQDSRRTTSRPTVVVHKTAQKSLPYGWEGAARGGDPTAEGADTEYIVIVNPPEILADDNPHLPTFNAVVALNY